MNSLIRPNGQLSCSDVLRAATFAVVVGLLGSNTAFAQDLTQDRFQEPAIEREMGDDADDLELFVDEEAGTADVGSAYEVSAAVTLTNAYYFRGFFQENDGFIVQPVVEIGFPIYTRVDENGDDVMTFSATLGTWNSFHSELTGNVSGPSNWYESDLYGTLSTSFNNGVTLYGTYTAFTSPNGAFSTVQEIAVGAAYDYSFGEDSLRGFGPLDTSVSTLVAFETRDSGGSDDIYWEINAEASKEYVIQNQKVTFAVPVQVGFSLDQFYTDEDGGNEFFGFVGVGLNATVPIRFVSEAYGDWYLTGGVQGLFFAADVLELANEGDDGEVIGSLGIGVAF